MGSQGYFDILREKGDSAKVLAKEVPRALADPEITLDQATALYQQLEQHAQSMEKILEVIKNDDEGDEAELLDPAQTLSEIYDNLARAAANKMIELRKK